MKRIFVLTALLLTTVISAFAQNPDHVKGVWVNEDKDVKVEIFQSGNEYTGKITWTQNMYEADGKTLRKDANNSKAELRSRTIVNMVILSGFTYSDGEWTGGELYDPKSGKTYKSKMWLKGTTLEIRGYAGMFGKTTKWTRVS